MDVSLELREGRVRNIRLDSQSRPTGSKSQLCHILVCGRGSLSVLICEEE